MTEPKQEKEPSAELDPAVDFPKILSLLQDAADECSAQKDYLSFSTILDVYTSDLSKYTDEQKLAFEDKLKEILANDNALLKGISWDLPALLIKFLNSDWVPVSLGFKANPVTAKFLKFFEFLCIHGTTKELLVTCCEEISRLRPIVSHRVPEKIAACGDPEVVDQYYQDLPSRMFGITFHSLVELVNSCIRSCSTLYPSKYLAAVSAALINFMQSPYGNGIPQVRRLYRFIRDYTPPNLPEDTPLSKETAAIVAEENYLQRKLLVMLLGALVESSARNLAEPIVSMLVSGLTPRPLMGDEEEMLIILNRFVSLAMSMDLEIDHMLDRQLKDAEKLFSGRKLNASEDVIRTVIDGYNKDLLKSQSEIPFSPIATIILYTYSAMMSDDKMDMSILDLMRLIKLQLKLFVPFTINPQLVHLTAVACSMVLTLEAISTDPAKAAKEFRNPKHALLLTTYLQNLSALCINSPLPQLRSFFFKYLVDFLKKMPDAEAYKFLVDSIRECPFELLQARSLAILKEMMEKDRPDEEGDGTEKLADELSKTSVSNGSAKAAAAVAVPPVPPRKYISYTPERGQDILKLLDAAITETNGTKPSAVQYGKLVCLASLIAKHPSSEAKSRVPAIVEVGKRLEGDEDVKMQAVGKKLLEEVQDV